MSDIDAEIEAFERLKAAVEPHLKAAILSLAGPEAAEMAEEEYAEWGALWLHGLGLAWIIELTRAAQTRGGVILARSLDEAMLPAATTDGDLTSGAGGIIDGQAIRDALRRCKASLPEGKRVPDALRPVLLADKIILL